MLVLTLRHGGDTNDHLVVDTPGEQVKIEILDVRNGKVRVGIHASDEVTVMRKKVLETATVPGWETCPEPISAAWTNLGKVDGWILYEDAIGRIYRKQGRIWQQKVDVIQEVDQ